MRDENGRFVKGTRFNDLTGERFGRLYVVGKSEEKKSGRATYWECLCDCGNKHIVRSDHLKNGHAQSCGCYNVDSHVKHGDHGDRLYHIRNSMISRCHNRNNNKYKIYGESGIEVCEEWRNSYESFRDWAYSNGYSEELTIDRINHDAGYYPENCRWVSSFENSSRTNKRVPISVESEAHGTEEFESVADFINKYNLPATSVHRNLKKGTSYKGFTIINK